MENSNKSNGILFLNSNAMEITTNPTPSLTYRTIGGIANFVIILGNNPDDTVNEYTNVNKNGK